MLLMQKKHVKFPSIPSLQIPMDLSVEMMGNRSVHVTGCRRIALYTSSKISLELSKGYLNVCGKGLTCTAYSGRSMGIEGELKCVFFSDTLSGGCR